MQKASFAPLLLKYFRAGIIFATWRIIHNDLEELEKALEHHLTKNRYANIWATKERFQTVMEGHAGRVIESIRRFSLKSLGNPGIEDIRLQADWSALMAELLGCWAWARISAAVRHVCDKIEASGAPQLRCSRSNNPLMERWIGFCRIIGVTPGA